MELKYKDFVPARIAGQKGGFFSSGSPEQHQSFKEAVQAANAWVAEAGVKVVNVETVVLPNIWAEHEEGTDDGSLYTGTSASYWHQFVRVWFDDEA